MSTLIPLENVRIASPCRADWNAMDGDERARFCGSCHKNVYNLAHMTSAEATQLIREKEGDACVRLYRRADGTIITDDCPIGIKIVRRPLKFLVAGFAALLASGATIFSSEVGASTPASPDNSPSPITKLREVQPFKTLVGWIDPTTQAVDPPVAGGIMPMPAPTPTPAPAPKAKAKKETK